MFSKRDGVRLRTQFVQELGRAFHVGEEERDRSGGEIGESVVAADQRPTPARAKALTGASMLALDDETGRTRGEEALALQRELDDTAGTAAALLALGSAYAGTDMERAREFYELSPVASLRWATSTPR